MGSLFRQTFHDFKILAVVADSNDGSVEYMQSIRDPRLRVLKQTKRGLANALNQMLAEADTPWLVRQDADDIAYPNRLERILSWVERFPEAGMFYSLADYHPKEMCLGQFRCTRANPSQLREIVRSGYLLSICHPSVVLNREKTLSIGGYSTELRAEDVDLWWRMALAYDVHFIPEPLIGYRQSAESMTSQDLKQTHIESLYHQYLLLSHLNNWPAQSLEDSQKLLKSFISDARVRSREKLRTANMYLAQKKYVRASKEALRSFMLSPSYFISRVVDEVHATGPITNGISPKRYLDNKKKFWPMAS